MANNCDYCHKPLSLMRRLRGEQFCSLEHMDQYAAQQAEFALERLSASVSERPVTERLPLPLAVPKSRPQAVEQVATSSVALQEPEPQEVARHVEKDAEIRPLEVRPLQSDSEYPMAAYLAQSTVEAKTSESTAVRKQAVFDPVDHWGKVAPAWSMPPFHSEPGDPRTWNAGKLVSQIPPVAGWRELLSPMDVERAEPASDDAQMPTLVVSVEQTGTLQGQPELKNAFPERLTRLRSLNLQRSTLESLIQSEQVANSSWAGPALTTVSESVRSAFRMAENRPDRAAHWSTRLRAQTLTRAWNDIGGPQFAPQTPVPGGIVTADTGVQGLELAGPQRFAWEMRARIATGPSEHDTSVGPTMPEAVYAWPQANTGIRGLDVAGPQRFGWETKAGVATGSEDHSTSVGPTMPVGAYTLPKPAVWTWTEAFRIPPVALPEIPPAPMAPAGAATDAANGWHELRGTLQNPAIQWLPPHLGYHGPTFGWESFAGKPALVPSSAVPAPAQFADIDGPHLLEFHARVRAGLQVPATRALQGWSTLKVDTVKLELGPLVALRPTVTMMAIQVRPLLALPSVHLETVHRPTSTLAPSRGSAPAVLAKGAAASPSVPAQARQIGIPGPIPALRMPSATTRAAKASNEVTENILQAGPLKYSPLAILVVPPPRFALLPAALGDEQRYAAQVPNGVWRLPRVRHTGYRALGPFPKLPLRLPDQHLRTVPSEVPPPFKEIPLQPIAARQDLSGIPSFNNPQATRKHPADYFAWPEPKGIKSTRILPEHQPLPDASAKHPSRRFGPGRAGLQSGNRSADGQARDSA